MTSFKRIISGTISGVVRNFINLIIIFFSLPIYLTFWEVELYSIWILANTISALVLIPISCHADYIQNEFLKIGKKNKIKISKILYGSILITLIILFLLIILILFIFNTPKILNLINIKNIYLNDFKIAILFLISAEIIGCSVNLLSKALYPFNYYPKIHWIGTIAATIIPLAQIISLFYGFQLVELSIITFLILNTVSFLFFIYFIKIIKKEKIQYKKLYFKENLKHFINSLYLLIGSLFVLLKNQGSRLILVPFTGTIQLVAYIAMRTASNIIIQFYSSFSNSLLIEYSKYLNNKDKKKFIKTYIALFGLLIFLITPLAFIFQIFISDLYEIWTRNKIEFDPILFGFMSISILITIFYQPALLIIKSKNIFIQESKITIFTSILFVIMLIFFIDKYSIRGAGYTLVITELIACFLFFYYADFWLKNNFIKFNYKIIILVLFDLLISSTFIILLALNFNNFMMLSFLFLFYKVFVFIFFYKKIFINHIIKK